MNEKYEFFIAGRTRNREKILNICNIFEDLNISHYCFLKNEQSHIEAGVAYGLGKKCYAIGEYDVTDSLYLIFDRIFADEQELTDFLKKGAYNE